MNTELGAEDYAYVMHIHNEIVCQYDTLMLSLILMFC